MAALTGTGHLNQGNGGGGSKQAPPPPPPGYPGGWPLTAPPIQQHPMLSSSYQLAHMPPPMGLDYGLGPPPQQQQQQAVMSARGKERLRYITDPEVWRQAEMQAAAHQQYSANDGLKGLAALTAAAPLSSFAKVGWPDMGGSNISNPQNRAHHTFTLPPGENLFMDGNSEGDTSSVSGASGK